MTASSTPAGARPVAGARRRLLSGLYRHSRVQLGLLLTPPLAWLGVIYLGSLAALFLSAFWRLDEFTGQIVQEPSLRNFETLAGGEVYRVITLRTVAIAALVTVTDIALAFPLAYYMARVASPRVRNLLFIAVLMPLWSSYLVRVYSWRIILSEEGPLNWLLALAGLKWPDIGELSIWLVFSYIWLPYMILPVYAGLERIPRSLLEASEDLGARGLTTLRRVILPLALPAIAAGSIFTFSLTLGDYITPQLVSSVQFIGNVVYMNVGIAGNLPFAAAFATVPVAIMAVYLVGARRLGAFEAL